MGIYFEYDRVIGEKDFCNFSKEKEDLLSYVEAKDCVKIYGLRNFGKTSLVKEIVAKKWEAKDFNNRIIIYIDLFSVLSLEDISAEFTESFNKAFIKNKSIIKRIINFTSKLKSIRPVWSPSSDSNEIGSFSFTTESQKSIIPFTDILKNIEHLAKHEKFDFLLILDEFQEIVNIPKAEAKLRGAFQFLESKVPIIILGSKYHLLKKIFNAPKAPFSNWGMSIELGPIPMDEYYIYMKERFKNAGKTISLESSEYIQQQMFREPEAINRMCEYIAKDKMISSISNEIIRNKMLSFVESGRSKYSEAFADLKKNERLLLLGIVCESDVYQITSSSFLKKTGLSKSSVSNIIEKLLNQSIVYRLEKNGKYIYKIADPFFELYLKTYKRLNP